MEEIINGVIVEIKEDKEYEGEFMFDNVKYKVRGVGKKQLINNIELLLNVLKRGE